MEVRRKTGSKGLHKGSDSHLSLIVSIRNSGTRFLQERLGISSNIHVDVAWDELIRRCQGEKIYVPMRKPRAIWKSWSRRAGNERPFPETRFVVSFWQMHALSLVKDLDFIAVDLQEDERITDWGPVGHNDLGKGSHPITLDMRPIDNLPFVKRLYG